MGKTYINKRASKQTYFTNEVSDNMSDNEVRQSGS